MELLGATAIEDKLQDGVPETISMLLRVRFCHMISLFLFLLKRVRF